MKQIEFMKFLFDNTANNHNITWNLEEDSGNISTVIGNYKILICDSYMIIVNDNKISKNIYFKYETENYAEKIREYVKVKKEEEFLESVCDYLKKNLN